MAIDYFGVIGDSHHTDKANRAVKFTLSGPRFYSEASADLTAFVNAMNADAQVKAIIETGDFNADGDVKTGGTILSEAEAIFDNFIGARYHVLGNWDMLDADFTGPQDWFDYIINGTRSPETIIEIGGTTYNDSNADAKAGHYYAFNFPNGGIGVVLDTHWTLNGDTFGLNHKKATVAQGCGAAQRTWLTALLAAHTTEPIVIFCHRWLYPDMTGVQPKILHTYFNAGDAASVISILEAAPGGNVVAVFQGHHHPGGQAWWDDSGIPAQGVEYHSRATDFCNIKAGIKYYCLRAPICGWGSNPDGPTTSDDDTEDTPANAYYKVAFGDFVKDKFDVKVTGYGTNPGGESRGSDRYAII